MTPYLYRPETNQEHNVLRTLFATILLIVLMALSISPANAEKKEKPPFPDIALSARLQGEQAIQALGNKLPEVAAWYGKTPLEFANMIRQDHTAWVDDSGRLFFVEDFPEQAPVEEESAPVESAPLPYDQTFLLHSRSGSKRVIYLDFDGYYTTGRAWNIDYGDPIDATVFDLDSNPAYFSNIEQDNIQQIWQHISEDYAPFDVDVTTEDPGQSAITRSDYSDEYYGARVVITSNFTIPSCHCGGFAYVAIFDSVNDFGKPSDYYKPAFVFYDMLGSSAKLIAEASSHEAGHNLGLIHDGVLGGSAYYFGHGGDETVPTSWAPIMGVGYYKSVTQWSNGDYLNANNTEDDLQIIQANGAVINIDDHKNTILDASLLSGISDGINITVNEKKGIIEKYTDIDFFEINSGSGSLSINIEPAPQSPNLDILVKLYDGNGNLIESFNPVTSLPVAIVDYPVAVGTYFLSIEGIGKGNPYAPTPDGYTGYASIGQYSINGSIPDPGGLQPPVSVVSATPLNGFSPLTVNFTGSGSYDPDGSIMDYDWDFYDNGAVSTLPDPTYIFDNPGSYLVTLTVTDNEGLKNTTTLTITVDNQSPIAVASATPTSGDAPLLVSFSSSGSNDPDGTISTWAWDFGDGNSSVQENPSHTYNTAGNYTATLTVTDNLGDSATVPIAITINPDPTINTLHVSDFTMTVNISTSAAKGGNKGNGGSNGTSATATIFIQDENGSSLKNVTVDGNWSGIVSGNKSSRTNRNGKVEITSPTTTNTSGTFTFTILNVSRSEYSYTPNQNNITRSISFP